MRKKNNYSKNNKQTKQLKINYCLTFSWKLITICFNFLLFFYFFLLFLCCNFIVNRVNWMQKVIKLSFFFSFLLSIFFFSLYFKPHQHAKENSYRGNKRGWGCMKEYIYISIFRKNIIKYPNNLKNKGEWSN